MKKKNRPYDKRNTPKKKKGKIEILKSWNKNDLEPNLFFTHIKDDGKDRGYCLLCDFNQESHKSNHRRNFEKTHPNIAELNKEDKMNLL